MRPSGRPHRLARFVRALLSLAAIVGVVPVSLIAVSRTLYQSANPTHGLTAPWQWTARGVRQALTHAIAEDELITTLCRVLLTVAWVLVAVVVVTVGIELVHQIRHRQPAPRIGGLGWTQTIARNIAAGLIIIATLTPAHPAHARPLPPRATATLTINPNTPWAAPNDTATTSSVAEPEVRWTSHVVRTGESVYSIAARLAAGDTSAAGIRAIAQQILDRNLGTTMPDGQRFTSPGYIETGWQLDLPTTNPTSPPPTRHPPPPRRRPPMGTTW